MLFMKGLLFLVPLGFFFIAKSWAVVAPAAALAAAFVLWALEPEEQHRLTAWLVSLAGGVVAYVREAPFWLLAAALPLGVLIAVEWHTQRQHRDDPARGTVLTALLAVLIGGFGMLAVTRPAALMAGGMPRHVVAIGDSLTAGIPGDDVARRWPEVLEERLGSGASVVSFAYPGDTAADSWNRWGDRVRSGKWSDTPGWKPDLVVVVLGGNDIRQQRGAAALEKDLRVWAQALGSTGAQVLFVQVPGAVMGDSYRDVWRRVAADGGFATMDDEALRTIWLSPSMTLVDRIHFNAKGHEAFADYVYRRISGK